MAAKQVIEILKRGEEFHKQLAAQYERLSAAAAAEDIKEGLAYLSHHEAHMGAALHDYNTDAPAAVRESWVKPAPILEAEKLLSELKNEDAVSMADLAQLASHLDDAVAQIFRQLAERSVSAEVREALEALTLLEDSERKKVLRGLTEN
jgi:hypothetical protein